MGSPTPNRPSRLVDLLRNYAHAPGASRVGFLARPSVARKRRVGLIALFDQPDATAMAAAFSAGVDAVEVQVNAVGDVRNVQDLVTRLAGPVGMLVSSHVDAALVSAAVEAGLDWVRFPIDTSAVALTWQSPARVASLPVDLDLRVALAANELPLDAVTVLIGESFSSSLTITDALRIRMLGDAIKKPVFFLLGPHLGVPSSLVPLSVRLGADALLVPATADGGQLAGYAEALEHEGADIT